MRYRLVSQQERWQRGCAYCAQAQGWLCPFERCPYTELDGFRRYQDYLKSEGATVPQIIKRLKEGTK